MVDHERNVVEGVGERLCVQRVAVTESRVVKRNEMERPRERREQRLKHA